MATGTAGSSFASELNRLANGGTYPAISAYLAPNQWEEHHCKFLLMSSTYSIVPKLS